MIKSGIGTSPRLLGVPPERMLLWWGMADALPPQTAHPLARAYYAASIDTFRADRDDTILGRLAASSSFAIEPTQRDAWLAQITIIRAALAQAPGQGLIAFEFAVPRMGKRIDVVLVLDAAVYVLEFKVGQREFTTEALNQVWDYALDMKNFHSTSHHATIVPVLVATDAEDRGLQAIITSDEDGVVRPLRATAGTLGELVRTVGAWCAGASIDARHWAAGRYSPTPTIIEAALARLGFGEVPGQDHRIPITDARKGPRGRHTVDVKHGLDPRPSKMPRQSSTFRGWNSTGPAWCGTATIATRPEAGSTGVSREVAGSESTRPTAKRT